MDTSNKITKFVCRIPKSLQNPNYTNYICLHLYKSLRIKELT